MASTSRWKRSSQMRDHPPSEKRPKVGPLSLNSREPELSEDESDTEFDMTQMSTQAERDGDKASELSKEAEVGVIEKIELLDFMCHRRLDVPLSPNVNFILGRNGSGKSAIMAGIMVALGGKAASTSRGSSLKQFIRTGAKSAEVVVTLRNRGSEAYNPDKYGERIVIERTVRADGTGSYKLKGDKGNTVSTKKEDLVAILDYYNIQIDNPVSLLSQDTSRNFLHSSNPTAKYKLFMRATHLEQIAHEYEKSTEEQKLMREGIEKKVNLLPECEQRAKELEEQVQTFERLREMEDKVEELQMELQWALVIEIEHTIPPIESDIEKQKERIPRNEAKMKKVEESLAKAEEDLSQISDELETMTAEAAETGQKRKEMHLEKRAKDKAVRDGQNDLSSAKRRIAVKTEEMRALEQARDDCIEKSQRDHHGEHEARLHQLEQHRESVKKVERALETAANDRKQFEHAVGHCMDAMKDNKSKMDGLNTKIKASEEHIHQLQSSRNDQLQVFGPWMRSLVDAIARNKHRFRKLPKGPIGSLIGLKDYHWARSIEAVLGRRLLNSFITDNQYDDQALKNLMKEVITDGRIFKPDTIQNRFEGRLYDVRSNLPQTPYPTVLDMLDVPDPDVLNALIDQCQVETILLIEKRQEAAHTMENVRPPKAKKAYTIEGDEVSCGKHYSNKMPRLNVIRASVDDAVREEKALCDRLKKDMDGLRAEDNRLKQDAAANKRHLGEVKNQMWKMQGEMKKLQGAIMDLENAEEEEEPQEDLATYESEILECQEQIQVLETEQRECEQKLRQLKEEQSECTRRVGQFEVEVENVAGKMEDLKRRAAIPEQNKKTASGHLQHFQSRLKEIRDVIDDLEKKATETRQRAFEAAEAASEVCERIETNRTQKSINTEITKLKRRITQEEPRLEEREAIQQRYIEAMDMYDKTQKQIREQKLSLKELEHGLKTRIARYQRIKERITERACLYFTHFLQQRDYDGKLKFNHEKEKLDIQVLIDTHTQASLVTKNTRSLSGGERSFTTVCFVMALWDAIEAPFRCLDEFDVFMDLFNRRISMKLMLEHAEDQPNRQFIFFTPQDMSSMGLQISSNVKVFRLQEPERGQTTLD